MNRLSLRSNRLKFKTGILPIILDEYMEYASNEYKKGKLENEYKTHNLLDFEH